MKRVNINDEEGYFTIIISVILGLLICIWLLSKTVFPLMRSSMTNVKLSMEKETSTSNVTLSDVSALTTGSEVKGAEVIGEIRLRASDSNVSIQVDNHLGTHVYSNESYDSNIFQIEYADIYTYKKETIDQTKNKIIFTRKE